jgi:hypothetical protein
MRSILFILILCAAMSGRSVGQTGADSAFNISRFAVIPEKYRVTERQSLFREVNPAVKYDYWELHYVQFFDPVVDLVLLYKGDSVKYHPVAVRHVAKPKRGFFRECLPLICFSYIVAVKGDSVETIGDEADLIRFIGAIDNMEELVLNIKAHHFGFDSQDKRGGAYFEKKDEYLLYLLEYKQCPVTYSSVRAVLRKTGELEVLGKEVYKEDKNECIIN